MNEAPQPVAPQIFTMRSRSETLGSTGGDARTAHDAVLWTLVYLALLFNTLRLVFPVNWLIPCL